MGEVLITGGRLIDGTGAAPRPADVLLRNDEIVAVGAPGSVPATATGADLRRIDATGKTVMPGLIDTIAPPSATTVSPGSRLQVAIAKAGP